MFELFSRFSLVFLLGAMVAFAVANWRLPKPPRDPDAPEDPPVGDR